jgi:hypothetical protein
VTPGRFSRIHFTATLPSGVQASVGHAHPPKPTFFQEFKVAIVNPMFLSITFGFVEGGREGHACPPLPFPPYPACS